MRHKPTPGPWEIKPNGIANSVTIHQQGMMGKSIARVWKADEGDANAHLIAAAPELLEACKQLLDRLDYHGSIDSVREEGPIEDLRQAVIKAEGRGGE